MAFTTRCSPRLFLKYLKHKHFMLISPKVLSSPPSILVFCKRHRTNGKNKDLSSLFQPIKLNPSDRTDDINVGAELAGILKKEDILKALSDFYRRQEIRKLAQENGLDNRLFHTSYVSFRGFCVESETLPVDLHIVFSDISQGAGHVDDLFPYFLDHARIVFPHLDCMEDLKKISDLRQPANWYPETRRKQRKIVYHAGPTNSGKTYHALQRYLTGKSGIYCGPLKLLVSEVFHKSNEAVRTPWHDMVTGEEKRYAISIGNEVAVIASPLRSQMMGTQTEARLGMDEVAVIERSLLGLNADEVHVCGEGTAIDLVKEMTLATGDEMEVKQYKRLTTLTYTNKPVESFDNVLPGDCIVCFKKNDIYHVSRQLEMRNKECAVIYGGLPPGTKLAQSKKFNDPDDPCNIMVATDAIGMGLNLAIKRIIFYTMIKPHMNEEGEMEMKVISTSQTLQIAGRAGRYNTAYEKGEVTTFKKGDLQLLGDAVSKNVEPLQQAGLHPTAEQIELFAYHLPKATLSNLIDIFVSLSVLDKDKYFLCNVQDFKFLADLIEHVPLPLRAKYVFCCSPIPTKQPFVCTMFLKFARQFSRSEPLTLLKLRTQINWPFAQPATINDLIHLEGVFDVLDLYLWLSYRFQDMFPDTEPVRDMQKELDVLIHEGVAHITQLLKVSKNMSTVTSDFRDDFEIERKIQTFERNETDPERSDFELASKLSSDDRHKWEKPISGDLQRIIKSNDTSVVSEGDAAVLYNLAKQGVLTHKLVKAFQENVNSNKKYPKKRSFRKKKK
ncbi:ATP-dependent RNA helicase SUPV3L1, mitochondrial-like [Haliotis rubra]|uniref:ATP-dependent RNA helicase SUPV3L1, mitochondrial-like n=1 Tax=Haliotis rubra TaxID=36100 RepID=UPI001EE538E5|nr:ATP-dependent RNA helicase SUPV3L1, mitochondrial-like [Haliotis rubra]